MSTFYNRLHAYDPNAATQRSTNRLPHWFQPNAATFVTFRLADSMPKPVIDRWLREQDEFLQRQGIPSQGHNLESLLQQREPKIRLLFDRYRRSRFLYYLNRGYGDCFLKQHRIANCLLQVLLEHRYDQYHLDSIVIMPNHVHLIAGFQKEFNMLDVFQNWLDTSEDRIRELQSIPVPFWQPEPFDHCIRSVEQFEWLQKYIYENPRKARISRQHYLFWKAEV